jgi:hypothetical protein
MLGVGIMTDAAGIGNPKSRNLSPVPENFYLTGPLPFGDKLFPASAFFHFGTGLTGCRTVRHSGILKSSELKGCSVAQ